MDYLAEIKRSPCLKEFFEFVFRTDVESAYNQLCAYDVMFEFEYHPISLHCVADQTDYIDYISISKCIECDPLIPTISYAQRRVQVFVCIHTALDNTPNLYLYMRFYRSDSFDCVERMVKGISAFGIVKCTNVYLNNVPCKNHDMMNMALAWISETASYDLVDELESYAVETHQFDELFDICNSMDDVYLKAALLNVHNGNPDAYKSEPIII